MSQQPEAAARELAGTTPSRFELRAEELLREPTLWPILLVLIGHAAAFLAPVLLMALRDRRATALVLAALLLTATGATVIHQLRRYGRLGVLRGTLLATWLLSGLSAWAADRWSFL